MKLKVNGVAQKNYFASLSTSMSNHSSMADSVTLTVYADRLVASAQIFVGYYYTDTWYCDDDTTITGVQAGGTTIKVGNSLNFNNYNNSTVMYVLLKRNTASASLSVQYEGETIKTASSTSTTTLNTAGKYLTDDITVALTVT